MSFKEENTGNKGGEKVASASTLQELNKTGEFVLHFQDVYFEFFIEGMKKKGILFLIFKYILRI